MRAIFKYQLEPEGFITVPQGSIPRHVHAEHCNVWVWVEQDSPATKNDIYDYFVVPSGVPMPEDALRYAYLGSTSIEAGKAKKMMLHVYMRKRAAGEGGAP